VENTNNSTFATRILDLPLIQEGVIWGRENKCEAHASSVKFLNVVERFSLPTHHNSARHSAIKLMLDFLFSFYTFDYIKVKFVIDRIDIILFEKKA